MNALEIEIAVSELRATGNFKVFRKLDLATDSRFTRHTFPNSQIGLCLDTETTGLDHSKDKIIELGIVAFEFNPDTAEIIRIIDSYSGFEDPGFPLPEIIKEITGLTDEILSGQAFDDDQVNALISRASLVVAHNAGFDRKFAEKRYPAFADMPWACSINQIPWESEGIKTKVLEYLLFKYGWFINAHRALVDAEGVLGLLMENLPKSGAPVFRVLLDAYCKETSKFYAVNAPYDMKDKLKARGYRWNDGTQGGNKSWYISVPTDLESEELAWLASEIYPGGRTDSVQICRVTAFDRFSVREK